MVGSILIISAIIFGYFHITKKIDARQSGVNVEGTVVEKHLETNYTYIRFKYPVQGKDLFKSMRISDPNQYEEGGKIRLTYLPSDPSNPFINFKKDDVDKELSTILTILVGYLIYRGIRIMVFSTRPNWD